jgi:hypothetical protein
LKTELEKKHWMTGQFVEAREFHGYALAGLARRAPD